MEKRLPDSFFFRDVLEVAPDLLGKILVRRFAPGHIERYRITEVEAYSGNGDLACHASKGKTARTEVMFREGGLVYVYLIYGMYWMLNIVTGKANDAAAVLIRGVENISGPGRIGKALQLDKSFYGEHLFRSERIWIEEGTQIFNHVATPRIGIGYAGEPWISKPWRYLIKK
jgi:DNA-3-methyladenine glycosylase